LKNRRGKEENQKFNYLDAALQALNSGELSPAKAAEVKKQAALLAALEKGLEEYKEKFQKPMTAHTCKNMFNLYLAKGNKQFQDLKKELTAALKKVEKLKSAAKAQTYNKKLAENRTTYQKKQNAKLKGQLLDVFCCCAHLTHRKFSR
jgi:glutamate-1-semialdehyde aminotransferase